ncbi:MAG: TolC family protein [Rickettsiales bacterium]|jgi:outer membrane protein TolC|nr:TolC family protein [Rickettsiales bacterium]
MKKKILLFVWALFVGFCGADARSLSLDNAVELVLVESQDIKKAAANIKKMQAVMDGLNAGRWFKIDATAAYQTNMFGLPIQASASSASIPASIDNIGTAGLTASMPIYTFGKIGYALDMAEKGVKIAETSKKLAEIETRSAAVNLYWSAKMTDEFVRIAEKSLKNTRSAQKQLTATGRANRSNLVKISADVASREIDLADAKFNRDSAFRMLKVYAGIDEAEPIVLTSDFPDKFSSIRSKEINPLEWEIYEAQAKMYDAEKWQNYMGYAPTIAASASYNYLTFADSMRKLGDFNLKSANIGVSISVPLFDGGAKRAAATQSAMSAISAREDLDKSRKLKSAEYSDLIQRHEYLRKKLGDLLVANDLAEKAYKLSKDRFLAGQTSAAELSDVERAQAQMEMAVFNAKLQILTTAENIKKYEQ